MSDEEERLRRRYERAKAKVGVLERMIEDQTRSLYLAHEKLRRVVDTVDSALLVCDAAGVIQSANASTRWLLGCQEDEIVGASLDSIVVLPEDGQDLRRVELQIRPLQGVEIPVLLSVQQLPDGEGSVVIATDLRDRKKLELDLSHARKLESVGQLAAGIAHEINTPLQFLSDSLHFTLETFGDLNQVLASYRGLRGAVEAGEETGTALSKIASTEEELDVDFLAEELPAALHRACHGTDRVRTIVKAMKAFSHGGQTEKRPANLNECIEQTLVVAAAEYRPHAEAETELGEIPEVYCRVGDLNQVLLNLVVNASQAMADRCAEGAPRGRLTVRSRRDGDDVVLEVADTGGGIPAEFRDRIFEPFFTTKDVGKGTGQGLALVHRVVVEGHAGKVDCEVEDGVGSTFVLRLPISGAESASPSHSTSLG